MLVYNCHWSFVLKHRTICRKDGQERWQKKKLKQPESENICTDRSKKWRNKKMSPSEKFRTNKKRGSVFSWGKAPSLCSWSLVQKPWIVTQAISNLVIRPASCKGSYNTPLLWKPMKFIKAVYLCYPDQRQKVRLTHERVNHRALLRVSMSCHFAFPLKSQRAWIAQSFPLFPVLDRGSKSSSSFLSLDEWSCPQL